MNVAKNDYIFSKEQIGSTLFLFIAMLTQFTLVLDSIVLKGVSNDTGFLFTSVNIVVFGMITGPQA